MGGRSNADNARVGDAHVQLFLSHWLFGSVLCVHPHWRLERVTFSHILENEKYIGLDRSMSCGTWSIRDGLLRSPCGVPG
jgi:hypothetical protein